MRFIVYLSESIEVPTENHAGKEETAPRSGEQVKSLVICLEDKPLGRRDIMQHVGISSRPIFVYDYLQPAIQAGLVEMTKPDLQAPAPACPANNARTFSQRHRR